MSDSVTRGDRQPIRAIEGVVAPLPIDNVDTDQIIPASYLKVTDKAGLAEGLFANWRYRDRERSAPDPDFVLEREPYREAKILLAGDNFGCGSSREHAPWALLGGGFQAVLSTGFADIFRNNALKNGLLAAEIDPALHRRLLELVVSSPGTSLKIDVERKLVIPPEGEPGTFEIDPFAHKCLLTGVDQLGYLLDRLPAIEAWEAARPPRIETRTS